jgi:aspartyl/asparaginyl beta-hydroxylase (cupin superfamily)
MKLDYHIFKSVVNSCYAPYVGGNRRPTFFNIDETYPSLNRLTEKFPQIKAEFDALLASHPCLPEYHHIDRGEASISATTAHRWNVCMLEVLGHRVEANRRLFPETCRALEQVPHLIQAFFSILDPGKSIPEHEGPYLGYLRYHLALRVPKDDPPKLVVNGQDYFWKTGEAVLFDDSYPHRVVNHSREIRAVLIVDVERPLPRIPTMLNHATLLIARHTYGRQVARNVREFRRKAA